MAVNAIIAAARAHFRADERRSVEVPEWSVAADADGNPAPLVLFWSPITLADKKRLSARHQDGGMQEMYVHALINKAQTADGKPAFSLEDKRYLMNDVDPAIVERIALQILRAPSLEDAEKN